MYKQLSGALIMCMICILCSGCGSSEISTVKNTPVETGSKTTIGNALSDYKFITNQEWEMVKGNNGVELVRFKADYNYDGIYESLFMDSKVKIPSESVKQILKKVPMNFKVVGLFKVDGKKITDSIIQVTSADGEIVVPISLPYALFINQHPIPKRFIGTKDASFYYYHFLKLCLENNYNYDTEYYYPIPVSERYSIYFDSKLKITKFRYDDKELTIIADAEFAISKDKLVFSRENSNNNSFLLNNIQSFSQEEYKGFIGGETTNSSIVKEIPFNNILYSTKETLKAFATEPYKLQFQGMACRLSINIISLEPFTASSSFRTDSPEFIDNTVKQFFREEADILYKKEEEAAALERKLHNSPIYALILNNSQNRDSQYHTVSFESVAGNSKSKLDIYQDSQNIGEYKFLLNIADNNGNNMPIRGICKERDGILNCASNNLPNNVEFGLASTNGGYMLNCMLKYGTKNIYAIPQTFNFKTVLSSTNSDIEQQHSSLQQINDKSSSTSIQVNSQTTDKNIKTGVYIDTEDNINRELIIYKTHDNNKLSDNKYNIRIESESDAATCEFEGECVVRDNKIVCNNDDIQEDADNYIEIGIKNSDILDVSKVYSVCGNNAYIHGLYKPACLDKILATHTVSGTYLGFFEAEEGLNTIGIKLNNNEDIYLVASQEEASKFFGSNKNRNVTATYNVEQAWIDNSCSKINVLKSGKTL